MLWDPDSEDIERIVKAFPSKLEDDVRAVVSILPFSERTRFFAGGNVHYPDHLVTEYRPFVLSVWGEKVEVPYRIYLNEPMEDKLAALSERQQIILHAFTCGITMVTTDKNTLSN